MGELYRAIWRVTDRQQAILIVLSVLVATVATVAALPLKFQQLAINSLIYGGDVRQLAWLCAGFLAALLLSARLKLLLGLRMATGGRTGRATRRHPGRWWQWSRPRPNRSAPSRVRRSPRRSCSSARW
ncbi:hypothetical protein [Geminicoccus flavidas]|uniref:hypothetical protein n=1 Tax=Geminicoccus flavidas TaxID=2506407 RepID=UPI00135BE204|nr:hypothetical protein [Geminicoccus flavidas]